MPSLRKCVMSGRRTYQLILFGMTIAISLQVIFVVSYIIFNSNCDIERIISQYPHQDKWKNQQVLINSEVIHLASGCYGTESVITLTTMVKTLLLYRTNPIMFHVLTDEETKTTIETVFETWKLSFLTVICYIVTDDLINETAWIPYAHPYGNFGLHKLLLDHILPITIEKVIVYDIDVIILSDILELWNHFTHFNEEQAIAMTDETQFWYNLDLADAWPAEGQGYNGGLLFYDLKKLRRMNWTKLWKEETKPVLEVKKRAHLAEQDILNNYIKNHPEIFYKLPCNWNIQFGQRPGTETCYSLYKSHIKGLHTSLEKLNVTPQGTIALSAVYKQAIIAFTNMDGSRYNPGTRRVLPFITGRNKCKPESNQIDVSLVMCVNFEEIASLSHTVKAWLGPVSVVIPGKDAQLHNILELLPRRYNVYYHFVYLKPNEKAIPEETCRTVAVRYSCTSHFIFSHTSFKLLPKMYDKLKFLLYRNPHIAIVTFKTLCLFLELPTMKPDLIGNIENGVIKPYTKMNEEMYERWTTSTTMFTLNWHARSEYHVTMSRKAYLREERDTSIYDGTMRITVLLKVFALKVPLPGQEIDEDDFDFSCFKPENNRH